LFVQSDERLARAFADQESRLQVEGTGTVIKLLDDDNEGSQHQRFIVRLENGQTISSRTILIWHRELTLSKVGDESWLLRRI
jgi:hypothetical protein